MVACSINFYIVNRIVAGNLCRFSSSTIYLFFILMKKIIFILKEIAKIINDIIIAICLTIIYGIICIYHLFIKKENRQWHEFRKKNNELEQTKHPW